MTTGKVTLLGAGPGDPDLLTLKAAKALAAADVLLLDDLVAPGIVELAPHARVIRVGKRGGCRSTPQAFIERLMRRYALRGAHVVRVKGGDALLFGRAGEELATLRAAAIPVDIVNGISSGFAAAASLGISLTHREHCQGVTFVTAHRQDHGERSQRHRHIDRHVNEDALHALRRAGGETDQRKAHVADRRVGNQPLQVLLADGCK